MSMEMDNASREGRRRRILKSGSDRLALITGQIQSLPPPSPPPSPSLPRPPPPDDHVVRTQQAHDHHINAGTEGIDETPAGSTLQKLHETSNLEVPRQSTNVETGSQNGPSSSQCDTTTNTMQPQLGTSLVQKATADTEPAIGHPRLRFFTSKRLNSCIVASESTRIVCSLIIAFLVLLSYVDYALFGVNLVSSESVVASRPLYIILLTDVTIVLARMILVKREEVEEERVGVAQDGHTWIGAVKLLERGLVVYQAIRGIFIDFSVYAVVVICGLSLVY